MIWGAAIGAAWDGGRYDSNWGGNEINVNRNTNINTGDINRGNVAGQGSGWGHRVEIQQAAWAGEQRCRARVQHIARGARAWVEERAAASGAVMRVRVEERAAGSRAAVRDAPRRNLEAVAGWAAAPRAQEAPAHRRGTITVAGVPIVGAVAAVAAAPSAATAPAAPRVPTVRVGRRAEARWSAVSTRHVEQRRLASAGVAAHARAVVAGAEAAAAAVDRGGGGRR